MSALKPLNLTCVKLASLLLIEANESTTSLDVKNHLRSIGYKANQTELAKLLLQASSELPLTNKSNGTFNTYSLPTPDAVVDDVVDDVEDDDTLSNIVKSPNKLQFKAYTKRSGKRVVGRETRIETDDWVVHSVNGSYDKLFFNTTYSRDEVRQAFANLNGVDFQSTRASRK